MRGKLLSYYHNRFTAKDHPAHAGKTPRSASRTLGGRESPRACGENFGSKLGVGGDKGLPSRVRGKHLQRVGVALRVRITPACAGKTGSKKSKTAALKDHPRVCGENKSFVPGWAWLWGSPPRVRGKHSMRIEPNELYRITPACAGKTRCRTGKQRKKKDHPRVCGENYIGKMFHLFHLGSPPRVRGKHACIRVLRCFRRITPACAGKTRRGCSRLRGCRDHPRVCGEN